MKQFKRGGIGEKVYQTFAPSQTHLPFFADNLLHNSIPQNANFVNSKPIVILCKFM